MISSSIQASPGESRKMNTDAATSWEMVMKMSGMLTQMKSTTTRMSSSRRLTVSPLWNLSLPLQVLNITLRNTRRRSEFWARTTMKPSQ